MSETDPTTHSSFISADSDELEVVLADSEIHVVEHPPGEESPEHTHEEDHIMFMRSGRMRWEVDGEVRETGPGETILTEAGVPHRFETLGDESAYVLCLLAPPAGPNDDDT